jgi:hypothetical protein
MEYSSAIKINEQLIYKLTRVNLKSPMLSERSQMGNNTGLVEWLKQ